MCVMLLVCFVYTQIYHICNPLVKVLNIYFSTKSPPPHDVFLKRADVFPQTSSRFGKTSFFVPPENAERTISFHHFSKYGGPNKGVKLIIYIIYNIYNDFSLHSEGCAFH